MKRLILTIVTVITILGLALPTAVPAAAAPVPGGTLDPTTIPKYEAPLLIPPTMPRTSELQEPNGPVDYYEIAVRQFQQQVLPPGMPLTTVWGYGSVNHPGSFSYPAYTVEATYNKPVRVKWINGLVDALGNFLPHLLPIDQTIHWANPPGGIAGRDNHGMDQAPYTGPVPIITHLHGAHVTEESDGFPEAWFLPAANNIPAGYATVGSYYDAFKAEAEAKYGQAWQPGTAVFQYPNDQRAATLWFHDHTVGMTRANVYAGPAGFYLLRGGPDDVVTGTLPTGAREIPLVIQDKSFNADGSLFYPGDRAFFEGLDPAQLQIPFAPDAALGGESDVAPIWNPEFFGNTMVVNGHTWPYLDVEQQRYRFRLLNASDSRFVILKLNNGDPIWQIGSDGGFLPAPVQLTELLLGPAERADIIVDFTDVPAGTNLILQNIGPDEPYGGGVPSVDFVSADPNTTGQVMQFRVIAPTGADFSTPPVQLGLPALTPLGAADNTRQVSLNELDSATVAVPADEEGNWVLDANGNLVLDPAGIPFGPAMARLGTLNPDGTGNPLEFEAPITENPALDHTEVWEIYNFTADAHPIHIHQVQFQVVNRESIATGTITGPEPGEVGFKDTLIAYPDTITRFKAKFDISGLYVWHCHILSHEDNEMMRQFYIGSPPAAPASLSAMLVSATRVDLTWTDSSTTESAFRIERSTDGTTFAEIGSVLPNATSFSDTALELNVTYYYRVIATSPIGDSAPSNAVFMSVAVPEVPTDLTAIVMSVTRVDLIWTNQSSNEAGFRIERSLDDFATAPGVTFAVAPGQRTFSDITVTATNTYSYRIVAFNAVGDSAPSNTATAKVTARLQAGPIDPRSIYQNNPYTGLPGYYQDDQGTRVALLPITGDGLNAPTQIYDEPVPTNPYSVFLGYGTEAFYYMASSVFDTSAGNGLAEFAIEAAFGGAGDAMPGQEFVFARTRIRIDVPVPGAYTIQHPYGTITLDATQADIDAGKGINYTSDIGVERDFAAATVDNGGISRFLHQTTPAPPAGWIGDGGSVGPVTGSPTGYNKVRVTGPAGSNLGGPGIDFVESNLFSVSGRLQTAATPIPSFAMSLDPTTGIAPAAVTFTDTSTGTPTAWLWDFGDGTTSTEQNPVHQYATAGDYTVRLTVANAAARVATSRVVRIYSAPAASFTYTLPNGIPPVGISFSDTSTGNPASWLWDFGDGSTSALRNPVHTYAAAGAYTNTLKVTNPAGTATASQTLRISSNLTAGFTLGLNPANGVAPVTVTLTDTSAGAVTDWLWDFGDGTTSTLQAPPAKTYDAAGNYKVTLTVTDAEGSAATSRTISIYSVPVASFTKSAATGVPPLTVKFTDTSTGNPTSWLWQFSDGVTTTTSNIANPVKTFSRAGQYSVTLTVTNPAGTDVTSQTVAVSLAFAGPNPIVLKLGPIAPRSIYQGNPDTGLPAYYEDDQGAQVSLLPIIGNGVVGPTQVFDNVVLTNPYSVFLGFGTEAFYYVASSVFDTSAGKGLAEFAIEAAFGGAGDAVPGQEFIFNRTRIRIDVPVPGTYTVQHPYGTISFNVTQADIDARGGINYTNDVGVQRDFLTAGTGNLSRFLHQTVPAPPAGWIGDGASVGPVTGSPTGYNKVRVTGPGGFFAESAQFMVSGRLYVPPPAVSFTVSLDPANGVAPVNATFTDTSTGDVVSWLWDFGDGATSNLPNPTKTYTEAGNYAVTLTVSNVGGTASTSQVVSAFTPPVASFTKVLSPANGVAPVTVTFTDTSTGNVTSWLWDFGDGTTSNLQNPTKTYTVAGNYTITLTATNPAGSASVSQTVSVYTPPVASFTRSLSPADGIIVGNTPVTVTFTDTSTGNITGWLWDFGDGTTSNVQNPIKAYAVAGDYTITLTATNAAGSASASQAVTILGPPKAPSALTATIVSPTQVDITWTDNAFSETSFRIERGVNGGAFAAIGTAPANATVFSDPAVALNSTYRYQVIAVNDYGESAPSNVVQILVGLPAAPTNLAAPSITATQVTLTWTDNAVNESAILVQRATDGNFRNSLVTFTLGRNVTTYTDLTVLSATRYFYRVLAQNGVGQSAPTNVVRVETPVASVQSIPAAPTTLGATRVEAGRIDIQWTDNASNEAGFRIQRSTAATFTENLFVTTVASNKTNFSDRGASAGITFYYRVFAFNSAGSSAPSNVISATPPAPTAAPVAPLNLNGQVLIGSVAVELTWNDASSDEAGFRIERADDPGFTQNVKRWTVGASFNRYKDVTGARDSTYYYRIVAHNAIGETISSTFTVKAASPDSAPKNLVVVSASDRMVDLEWEDTTNNETGFLVERATDAAFTADVTSFNVPNPAFALDNTGPGPAQGDGSAKIRFSDVTIEALKTYHYHVRAVNDLGQSADSAAVTTAVAVTTLPGAPFGLVATPAALGRNDLTWIDNANNETGFRVERSTDDVTFAAIADLDANATSYSDTAATSGATYSYRVIALNTLGESQASNVAVVTSLAIPAPSELKVAWASPQAKLTWIDNSATETGFRIERSTNNFTTIQATFSVAANTTTFNDAGITVGITYSYRVVAVSDIGDSPVSNVATIKVMPPAEPAEIGASAVPVTVTMKAGGELEAPEPVILNSSGKTTKAARLESRGKKVAIAIPAGTTMRKADGTPLTTITSAQVVTPPPPPASNVIVASQDFGPDGASFSPAITLTISYDPASLPAGVTERDLAIAFWDGAKWVTLETTVDTQNKTASAQVTHFTAFALLGAQTPPPAPAPMLNIVSPKPGDTLVAGSITVTVSVAEFQLVPPGTVAIPGQGHLHYYLDVPIPTTPGAPAVTAPGTYKATPGTAVAWENVMPGTHTFGAQLVNVNHTPLEPPVTATVTVTVTQPVVPPVPQPPAIPAPTVPPAPVPTPAPSPAPVPMPSPTLVPAPLPTTAPGPIITVVPAPVPAPSVIVVPAPVPAAGPAPQGASWWLIGSIIGAVVVLGLLIFLVRRPRSTG